MAIILTSTDGYFDTEVPDKTIKELAGIKLVGKGAANLVKVSNENLLKMLQNLGVKVQVVRSRTLWHLKPLF